MDQHMETVKRAVSLAETCRQGLEKIKSQINQGEMEHTMLYFNHIANAFYDILQQIQPVLEKAPSRGLESLSQALHQALGSAVEAYEQKNQPRLLEIMQFTLVPAYQKWQAELKNSLQPYFDAPADLN